MSKVTNKAIIYFATLGKVEVEVSSSVGIGGFNRNEVMSSEGVAGYTEEHVAPMIECTAIHKRGVSLSAYNNIVDDTAQYITDTGAQFVLHGAFLAEPAQLEAEGGKVKLSVKALRADEVL